MTSNDFKENCFDVLRIIGAYIVLFSHSFRHFEVPKPEWASFLTEGSVGVMIFFTMTGFLMMASWENTINRKQGYLAFLKKRILRLYPMVWLSFFFVVAVDFFVYRVRFEIGPFIRWFFEYGILTKGSMYMGEGIGNGVLWTIIPDLFFYILTPIVYKIMHKANEVVSILIVAFCCMLNFFDEPLMQICENYPGVRFVSNSFFIYLFYEFLIGSYLYFRLDKVRAFIAKFKYAWIVLIGLFVVWFDFYGYSGYIKPIGVMHSPYLGIVVPFIVIIIGYSFGCVRFKVEISYEIFILHMIVVGFLKGLGVMGYLGILLTVVITPLVALAVFYGRKAVRGMISKGDKQ